MIRTFIYGSCVSRDTFEHLRPHQFELIEYVARQSLLSAYSPAEGADMPSVVTSSAFQRRMVEGDWSGSLLQRLRTKRSAIDLLLWDLCDERLGVWRLGDGRIVTRSVDGISSGLDAAVASTGERVPLGDAQHRALFEDRLVAFRQDLDDLGLRSKTLVLAPPWATHDENGRPTPSSYGLHADRANMIFRDYHDLVEDVVAVPVLRLEGNEVRASGTHRWGPAPFHYAEHVYRSLVCQIQTLTTSVAGGRP